MLFLHCCHVHGLMIFDMLWHILRTLRTLHPPPPHHEPNISLFGFTVVETPSKATGKLSRTRLTWIREHMQHCPGKYDQSIIFKELRNSLTFRFREHSQNIIGNRGDFENFSWEHGNTDPLRGLWV